MTVSIAALVTAIAAPEAGIHPSAAPGPAPGSSSYHYASGNGTAPAPAPAVPALTPSPSSPSSPPSSSSAHAGAVAYFGVSTVTLLAALAGYFALEKLPITREIRRRVQVLARNSASPSASNSLGTDEDSVGIDNRAALVDALVMTPHHGAPAVGGAERRAQRQVPAAASAAAVRGKLMHPAFSVAGTFFVTLAIFPGITAGILPDPATTDRTYKLAFTPLGFLLFNSTDFLSRIIAGRYQWISMRRLWIATVARLAFFPLFLACRVSDTEAAAFSSDAWPMLFIILLGLSNGYITTLGMMYGSSNRVVKPEEMSLAGRWMVFALTFGLTAGSAFSFAPKAYVCQCNPFTNQK